MNLHPQMGYEMKTQYLIKGVPNVTVTLFSDRQDLLDANRKASDRLFNTFKGNVDEYLDATTRLSAQLFPGVVHKNNMKRMADQGATDCRFISV